MILRTLSLAAALVLVAAPLARADEFTDLSSKLPKELREAADPFDPTDPETIRLLVGEVEQLLLPRLTLEDA